MPTFAQLLGEKTAGLVWLLDVSFDDFTSVSYRWSTASVRIDGNEYDGRIASITPIERGFGRDHLPAATTTKLRIDNSDFAADWLVDRATVGSQLLQARFRLTAHLYESRAYTSADALSGASQVLGVFTCLDQPEATADAVDVTLADDSLGRLAEPLNTPTVRDWKDAAVSLLADTSLNPFNANDPVPLMDWDVPLPLVFGLGAVDCQVPAYAAVATYRSEETPPYPYIPSGGSSVGLSNGLVPPVKWPIVICAAKANTQPAGVDEIVQLYATYGDDIEGRAEFRGVTVDIPRFGPIYGTIAQPNSLWRAEIWRPRRSAVFTKSGREWQIVWVEFNVDHYYNWFKTQFADVGLSTSGSALDRRGAVPTAGQKSAALAAAGGIASGSRGIYMGAFSAFQVRAGPRGHLSMVTTRFADDLGYSVPSQRLVDMIYDAIAHYSKASVDDMDAAAWERASKARATVLGAGIIQPSRPRPLTSIQRNGWISPNPRDGVLGVLRSALGEMCSSADVDLFMTKESLYSVSTNVFDYDAVTGTRVNVDEARTSKQRTRTPSDGERWAPYNRVTVQGPGGAPYGPWDNQDAIDAWGIIKPITLQGKWNARLWSENIAHGASTVWAYRTLESKVRPVIRFNADREYLGLELGEYFEFTWSRGGQSSFYSNTIFRLESMRIDPGTLAVELSAIWADDLATVNPYLLDDETYLTRVASTAGRTASVTDSSATVTFSSGNLTSDGVAAGDILVLKDSTQAANIFTRYRSLLITGVTSTTTLTVAVGEGLDFDAPGGAAVATWEILRGATTYHDSVSDPTNYPNDGAMYGKACDPDFLFSDASDANQLLDG